MELTVCSHIPGEFCNLYGISDTHIGSPDCDEELLAKDIATIEKDPYARVFFNGDLLNCVTKKSKGDVYHEKYSPSKQRKIAREIFAPVAKKTLVILGGNHDEMRSDEDATPIADLAEWLGVKYCMGEALLKISVGAKEKNGKPAVYTLFCTHGWTSSRLIGGKALNLDRLKDIVLADIYAVSHTHTQHVHKDLYYVPDLRNENVMECVRYFVNLGSYQSRGQYPIRKGLPGQVLGTPLIRLSGTRKEVKIEI